MAKVSFWSYVSKFRKRNERHFLVLTSTIKRGISMFQVVVLQWLKARKLTKSVMLMQSCCWAHLNLLRFWLIFLLPSPSSLFELHILSPSLLLQLLIVVIQKCCYHGNVTTHSFLYYQGPNRAFPSLSHSPLLVLVIPDIPHWRSVSFPSFPTRAVRSFGVLKIVNVSF